MIGGSTVRQPVAFKRPCDVDEGRSWGRIYALPIVDDMDRQPTRAGLGRSGSSSGKGSAPGCRSTGCQQSLESCLAEMIIRRKRNTDSAILHHQEGQAVGQAPVLIRACAKQFLPFLVQLFGKGYDLEVRIVRDPGQQLHSLCTMLR